MNDALIEWPTGVAPARADHELASAPVTVRS